MGYIVIRTAMWVLDIFHVPPLMMMAIFIVALADGLAEPIGIRFGKHLYETKALFTPKRYVRSLEGSLCVFFVSMAIVAFYAPAFSATQYACALLLIPATAMLAEAFSPHTCDAPLIYIATAIDLVVIGYIA